MLALLAVIVLLWVLAAALWIGGNSSARPGIADILDQQVQVRRDADLAVDGSVKEHTRAA